LESILSDCRRVGKNSITRLISSLGCSGGSPKPKGGYMKGARYFLRNFTATAVREHLRSQIEDTGGSPKLTKNELELVRFIC